MNKHWSLFEDVLLYLFYKVSVSTFLNFNESLFNISYGVSVILITIVHSDFLYLFLDMSTFLFTTKIHVFVVFSLKRGLNIC